MTSSVISHTFRRRRNKVENAECFHEDAIFSESIKETSTNTHIKIPKEIVIPTNSPVILKALLTLFFISESLREKLQWRVKRQHNRKLVTAAILDLKRGNWERAQYRWNYGLGALKTPFQFPRGYETAMFFWACCLIFYNVADKNSLKSAFYTWMAIRRVSGKDFLGVLWWAE